MKGGKVHRRTFPNGVVVAVAGLSLGGCMVGPDYERPEAKVNPSWLESSPALSDEPAEIQQLESSTADGVDLDKLFDGSRPGDTAGTYLGPQSEEETGESP